MNTHNRTQVPTQGGLRTRDHGESSMAIKPLSPLGTNFIELLNQQMLLSEVICKAKAVYQTYGTCGMLSRGTVYLYKAY